MKKRRVRHTRTVLPKHIVKKMALLCGLPFPLGSRLVVTLWVSAHDVSEEQQAQLQAHLVEHYRAGGVLTSVAKGPSV